MSPAGSLLGGGSGAGTTVLGGAQGAIFTNVQVVVGLVADAFVAPTDTPVVDTLRFQYDAGGEAAAYLYIVALAAWRGVEMS